MSIENIRNISEPNSGDSDFEIITDSDAETNGYLQLKNENGSELSITKISNVLKDYSTTDITKKLCSEKSNKIKLSLSQDQISILGVVQPCNEKSIQKSCSSNFPPYFTIIPIDISAKKNASLTQESKLPEIVLTSFESNKQNSKKNNESSDSTSNSSEKDSTSSKSSSNESSNFSLFQLNKSVSPKKKQRPIIQRKTKFDEVVQGGAVYASSSKPLNLVEPSIATYQLPIDLRSSSSETSILGHELSRIMESKSKETLPPQLKCSLCDQPYNDPRTLNCLHSFCFQCIFQENYGKDANVPFWSNPRSEQFSWPESSASHSTTTNSEQSTNSDLQQQHTRPDSRSSFSSFRSRKTSEKQSKERNKSPAKNETSENTKPIVCPICNISTNIPIGGIRQLPPNFILSRKIQDRVFKTDNGHSSNLCCSLCTEEISATHHCLTCMANVCCFCKEAHERQRNTSNHDLMNILELQQLKNSQEMLENEKRLLKCLLHPGMELKYFCTHCEQLTCIECNAMLHKGHKYESVLKIFKTYSNVLREATAKTRPVCEYTAHSVSKLTNVSKKINEKCDEVQNEVDMHMIKYFQAVEVHRQTLLQQISRARETKIQKILDQQQHLEQKSLKAKEAIEFSQEVLQDATPSEMLSFVRLLLRRLEYCQSYKAQVDSKISETLHFLPEIRAPSTKEQNDIPLFGIITTQTVEPTYCTLETEGYANLRVHRKAELTVLTRDADGVPLCHGGLTLNIRIIYKECSSRIIPYETGDRRDGTYTISFLPEVPGTLSLSIIINNKHITGSPFTIIARTTRPHSGIFHCCTFCSSKGSKAAVCACNGIMPGYKGCGHGHYGHPGRRHWSCCASVLENSECVTANTF